MKMVVVISILCLTVIAFAYSRMPQSVSSTADPAEMALAVTYCMHAVVKRDPGLRPPPSGLIQTGTGARAWETDQASLIVGESYDGVWQCTLTSADPVVAYAAAEKVLDTAVVLVETTAPWASAISERVIAEVCYMGRRLCVKSNVTFAAMNGTCSLMIRDVPGDEGHFV